MTEFYGCVNWNQRWHEVVGTQPGVDCLQPGNQLRYAGRDRKGQGAGNTRICPSKGGPLYWRGADAFYMKGGVDVRCRYDREIYSNPENGYCIFQYLTEEPVPEGAKNSFYKGNKTAFVAVGYHLPNGDVLEYELNGTWAKAGMDCSLRSNIMTIFYRTQRTAFTSILVPAR